MKKSTITFDLDGTLIATMDGFADIAASLINEHFDIPVKRARELYIETSGIAFCNQLEVIFPKHARNKMVAEEFEKRKLVHFFEEAPDTKTVEALKKLKNKGYRLCVSSNNYHDIVNRYVNMHFPEIFDVVLGYEEGFAKGPAHFEKIYSVLQINNNDMIFVADSLSDLRLAKKCSVDFVGVQGIFANDDFQKIDPDVYVLDNLWNLPLFLAR